MSNRVRWERPSSFRGALLGLLALAACSGDGRNERDEEGWAETLAVETPEPENAGPPSETTQPLQDPPARQTGEPLLIEPPPILELRDDAKTAELLNTLGTRHASSSDPHLWIHRFREQSTSPEKLTLALVEMLSMDGTPPSGAGVLSTWKVHKRLAGPALDDAIVLLQPEGRCTTARGFSGRIDAMLIEPLGSYYQLLDNNGQISYMISVSESNYRWLNGPEISSQALLQEADQW